MSELGSDLLQNLKEESVAGGKRRSKSKGKSKGKKKSKSPRRKSKSPRRRR